MTKDNFENREPGRVYADPRVDFAFKRIFGSERYKDATIGLLNSIIKEPVIKDVSFEPTEILGDVKNSRNSVIDVLCSAEDGTKFIVEMQKAKQKHFRERMIFYTSKLIANQEGIKGTNFGYDIKPVHVVSFINFDFGKKNGASPELDRPILRYKTTETELGNEMPGSSRYFFLNIPRFKKNLENLNDNEEIWLYLLRDSKFLDKIPEQLLGNKAFETYFEASRRVGFTEQENQKYIEDMMNEWDIENAMNEAVAEAREDGMQKGLLKGMQKGMEKGRQDERLEIARKMLAKGISHKEVSEVTALPLDEIESLQ